MGDPISTTLGATGAGLFGKKQHENFMKGMELPEIEPLPAPVKEEATTAVKTYTKDKLKSRKGRKSTILASLGSNQTGKKTILG